MSGRVDGCVFDFERERAIARLGKLLRSPVFDADYVDCLGDVVERRIIARPLHFDKGEQYKALRGLINPEVSGAAVAGMFFAAASLRKSTNIARSAGPMAPERLSSSHRGDAPVRLLPTFLAI